MSPRVDVAGDWVHDRVSRGPIEAASEIVWPPFVPGSEHACTVHSSPWTGKGNPGSLDADSIGISPLNRGCCQGLSLPAEGLQETFSPHV